MIRVLKGLEPKKISVKNLETLLGVFTVIITDKFVQEDIEFINFLLKSDDTIFLNVICSGYSGSPFEPSCPTPSEVKKAIQYLLAKGFPASNLMLTISPVIRNQKGIQKTKELLNLFVDSGVYKIRVNQLIQSSQQRLQMHKKFGRNIVEDCNKYQIEELQNLYPNFKFYYCTQEDASCSACVPPNLVHQLYGCVGTLRNDRICSSLTMSTIQLTKMDECLYYYR